jgi:hypothetical protein
MTCSDSFSGKLVVFPFSSGVAGSRFDATADKMTVDSSSTSSASPDGEVSFATDGSRYTLAER